MPSGPLDRSSHAPSATISIQELAILDLVVSDVVDKLAGLSGVVAITLGGSRSLGTHLPSSDWDIGLYYRSRISVDQLRRLGYGGEIAGPGEWGRIINGGAWWNVEGRKIDVLLRDLDAVEFWNSEAEAGRFEVDNVHGYLAGLPTYTLAAELALGQLLVGQLPKPTYPELLRRTAPEYWSYAAAFSLLYADRHAAAKEVSNCFGAIAKAAVAEGHSRLAAQSKWVLNEKGILGTAGLDEVDAVLAAPVSPDQLSVVVQSTRDLLNLLRPGPALPPGSIVRRR